MTRWKEEKDDEIVAIKTRKKWLNDVNYEIVENDDCDLFRNVN